MTRVAATRTRHSFAAMNSFYRIARSVTHRIIARPAMDADTPDINADGAVVASFLSDAEKQGRLAAIDQFAEDHGV